MTVFDLPALWGRLSAVNTLQFVARSVNNDAGWNGTGRGGVVVESVASDTMLFHEQGKWLSEARKELSFTNVYRWSSIVDCESLRLEHLRFGNKQPVYLFDLQQTGDRTWASIEPHVCRDDLYTTDFHVHDDKLSLRWTINGPGKNESIDYSYR